MGAGHPRRASRRGRARERDAARGVAYAVVRRSLDSGAYADRAIDGEATRAGLDAAAACIRVVPRARHGAAPAHARCGDRSTRPSARPDRLERPLLHALRLGTFQLLFAGSVPDRAAVSETVELVRTVVGPRATGLANAVLRRVAGDGPAWLARCRRTRPRPRASGTRCPTGCAALVRRVRPRACARALCRAANVPARSVLRPNPLRAGPGEVGGGC